MAIRPWVYWIVRFIQTGESIKSGLADCLAVSFVSRRFRPSNKVRLCEEGTTILSGCWTSLDKREAFISKRSEGRRGSGL